ncbi:hypothetical protein pb186bvf_016443 [Paramecium bursaria]
MIPLLPVAVMKTSISLMCFFRIRRRKKLLIINKGFRIRSCHLIQEQWFLINQNENLNFMPRDFDEQFQQIDQGHKLVIIFILGLPFPFYQIILIIILFLIYLKQMIQRRTGQKIGVLVGFQNEKKKRVAQILVEGVKQDDQITITKYKGFSLTNKQQMQMEIKEFVKQHREVNAIYVVLKYDRVANMKKKLHQIMNHFKKYLNNLFLLISDFQPSEDRAIDEIQVIKKELQDYFQIQSCFLFKFGQNSQDIIYQESTTITCQGFLQKTIKNKKKILFETKHMDLDQKINLALYQEINTFITNKLNEQTKERTQKTILQKPKEQKLPHIQLKQQHKPSRENSTKLREYPTQQRPRSSTIQEQNQVSQSNKTNDFKKGLEMINKKQNYKQYFN